MQRLLKMLVSSKKRYKIILNLSDVPKPLTKLSKALGIKPSNLLPHLRALEFEGLVKSENGKYKLTESGS
ncbi:ArsR family transcriptional regulator [Methanotorris formicicus]|uniref:Regulatory protein ArsR n=1 Tax=Methanotorris formicicus Mc-S-70 TaxID=647171 RepID=H1KYX8_9EURY|nr:ArsR family transcriptional regulator [Methanotorris formicicus]EHP86713.1 regulatory protein ArsR [Methanotorris formicicus Mc-S-70]